MTSFCAAPETDSSLHLFVGKRAVLAHEAPPGHVGMASDADGAFSLSYTFERAVQVGDRLALTCWMDADSVARGKFAVTLARRDAPERQRYGEGDRPLPCITSYCPAAPGACSGKLPVQFKLVTTPTTFLAGDRLIVTVTLACAKGCETVMRGQMYYGAQLPSSLVLDTSAVPGNP